MKVAVAGGTGVVGRHVVAAAGRRGHEVVVLARAAGVDLVSGEGLTERLEHVTAVIDVTGIRTQSRGVARRFFGTTTRTLLDAAAMAGATHHVALSIVGVDRVDTGYYAGKLHQEELVHAGPLPFTVLRSTQFHEFAAQALGFATLGPLAVVPRMRIQPVAAQEVADALIDLIEDGPRGRVPDLAGPEVHDLAGLARRVARDDGGTRRVVGVRLPGPAGRAMRTGALLPSTAGPRGQITFSDWLHHRG